MYVCMCCVLCEWRRRHGDTIQHTRHTIEDDDDAETTLGYWPVTRQLPTRRSDYERSCGTALFVAVVVVFVVAADRSAKCSPAMCVGTVNRDSIMLRVFGCGSVCFGCDTTHNTRPKR